MGRRAAVQSSSGGIAVCVLMGTEVPWSAVMQTVGKLSLLCLGVWVCPARCCHCLSSPAPSLVHFGVFKKFDWLVNSSDSC